MKVKLSYDLTMKLISLEENDFWAFNFNDPEYDICFELFLDEKLIKECQKWIYQIETYFKTSYTAYKIDIGQFEGLWPIKIYSDSEIQFRADYFDPKRKNWKDWFIVEEEIKDAPHFIQGD